MRPPTDQDGKSKTASAVDASSYPEQNEVAEQPAISQPSEDEIRVKAFELWVTQGRPKGKTLENWLDAERKLRASVRADIEAHREHGSVQR